MKHRTIHTAVYMRPETRKVVEQWAKRSGESVSSLINRILEDIAQHGERDELLVGALLRSKKFAVKKEGIR